MLAALVLVAGFAGFAWHLLNGLSSLTEGFTQLVVPGQHELTLSEPGRYTIFHAYRSSVGNKVYSMDQGALSGLQCSLRSKVSSEEIPLSPSVMSSTYSMGARSGVSILDFSVDSTGTYQLSADYARGEEESEAVLSVGRGFVKQLLMTIVGGLAIMFFTMAGAAAVAVTTFVKRLKATNRLRERTLT